jgi:glyoxylase-like metal-dependent hydrolase (beta-lactamase superfamily II)
MDQWQFGEIGVTRILEMVNQLDTIGEFFPDATEAALAPHLSWLSPRGLDPVTGRLIMPMQSYLVRSRHHRILIDTCVGNNKTHPTIADWHRRSDDAFLTGLTAAGIRPEEVDFVLCTHLHSDHCGWNTRLLDGRWVPTFPKARYLIAKTEYEAVQASAGGPDDPIYNDSAYQESVLPIVAAGQADFVAMDHALDDHVRLLPTPGHTPGHVAVQLESKGALAIACGDLMHSPIQCVYPEWGYRYDADPELAKRTRRAFLESGAESGATILTAHFPLPSVGHIRRRGDAFRFDDGI